MPEDGHGAVPRRRRRQRAAAEIHPSLVHTLGPEATARRRHRQGDHVRLGWPRSETGRRHAADEERHVGRGGRAGDHARAAAAVTAGGGAWSHCRHREHAVGRGGVLRAMNGTTVEIGNTDAEGRLTLADALCYATEKIKPDEVVDMVTLTGACVVALGPLCSGLFANDQGLADRLLEAATNAGERFWQLPLIDEYREHLKSEVADINNVGPRGGGAINAALFLKEFAGTTPWAHVDIAGPAFTEKDLPLGPKGGTGVAVRTILTYLTS